MPLTRIETPVISDANVTSPKIAVGAITSNLIATGAITGNLISFGAIRGNNIVANTITGNLIGQSAISSNNILTNAVTNDKINSVANTKITGLITSAQIASDALFASGTLMLFQQTSAPTGWTKQTTHDNKALRVVSGSASSGGSVAFTTAFANGLNAGSTTLTTPQIPSHTHTAAEVSGIDGTPGTGSFYAQAGNTGSTGGGGSHNHTLPSFAVAYVDLIIASKD